MPDEEINDQQSGDGGLRIISAVGVDSIYV